MEEDATTGRILREAQGAHATSREILELMQEEGEGGDDPIQKIIWALQVISGRQRLILHRLKAIERHLGPPG